MKFPERRRTRRRTSCRRRAQIEQVRRVEAAKRQPFQAGLSPLQAGSSAKTAAWQHRGSSDVAAASQRRRRGGAAQQRRGGGGPQRSSTGAAAVWRVRVRGAWDPVPTSDHAPVPAPAPAHAGGVCPRPGWALMSALRRRARRRWRGKPECAREGPRYTGSNSGGPQGTSTFDS